ncbi:MAG: hypothetical protein AVDCRST_MAG93-3571 [uncultured Chloroflexia bacterium]|uniref:Uncharacterized protein n=1 Tax=uncultured Chloroflexia bacterium TaxID=1672391 RepID=A0A6J4JSL2_9CHLR|nr:MAG: hypothetical protein AVDCRST_MAG93-3571 [uncultured Chloroflexia bacterium]
MRPSMLTSGGKGCSLRVTSPCEVLRKFVLIPVALPGMPGSCLGAKQF